MNEDDTFEKLRRCDWQEAAHYFKFEPQPTLMSMGPIEPLWCSTVPFDRSFVESEVYQGWTFWDIRQEINKRNDEQIRHIQLCRREE